MRKRILSFGVITLSTLFIGIHTTHAGYTNASEAITDAIALSKSIASGDYGKFVIPTTMNRYETIRFLPYQREDLEGAFRIAINNAYQHALNTSTATGFEQAIYALDRSRITNSLSGSLSSQERAKNMFWDTLYVSFITLWRNPPTANPIPPSHTPHLPGKPAITPSNTQTSAYTFVENYTTASKKTYGIWSAYGKYRFQKTGKHGFGSLEQLHNYLERQNRIIYTAPNGRMYGIFFLDGAFYFNRDEGSVSKNSRSSVEDVKIYLNQHNQPLPGCMKASVWRCH